MPAQLERCAALGEAAHVGADFGHHHFGGAPLNARDRDQTFNRGCERCQQLLDAPAEYSAGFLDIVDAASRRLTMKRW
jgi:hypothetical protein